MKTFLFAFLISTIFIANAGMPQEPPTEPPTEPVPTASSSSNANAEAAAQASAEAAADATSDASVTASQNVSFNAPRNIPSIYAGSNYPTAPCLASFTIGGSAEGGGGLLSINLDKEDCQLVSYSQAFAALQQWQVACDLLRSIKGVRAAYKKTYGTAPPECAWPEAVVPEVPVKEEPSNCITQEQFEEYRREDKERAERQFEKCMQK